MKRTLPIAIAILIVGIIGTAGAASLITGKDIKNNSLKTKDVKNHTLKKKDLKKGLLAGQQGAPGAPGQDGEDGEDGQDGVDGQDATYSNPQWGEILRNEIGSPSVQLRGGPVGAPLGDGSLELITGSPNEKASFGDEVDFTGDKVADLTDLGFYVYTVGENNENGEVNNMPSIGIEIDPKGAGGTTTSFSTLTFAPNATPPGWSPYIDATDDSKGFYGLTGSQFNSPATAANCGLNGPRCTYSQVQAFLATGSGATIRTVAVTKGRDYEFQGAVDGLQVNNEVFDFEPFGVNVTTP